VSGLGDLVSHLVADTSQWTSGFQKAQGDADRFAAGITSSLTGMLTQFASVGAAVGIVTSAFAAAEADVTASKKLEAVLSATGHTAGVTTGEIEELAGKLQRVTKFEDDATVGAAAMLATFKNIKGDNFKETLALAQDFAAIKGVGLEEAVNTLGKALNNPVEGMDKLKRSGISLNEEQHKLVLAFMAAGDAAGAQKVILDELDNSVGGAAEATVTATERIKNAWGSVLELGGKQALPFADLAANIIGSVAANEDALNLVLANAAKSNTFLAMFLTAKDAVIGLNDVLDDTPEKLKAILPDEDEAAKPREFDLSMFEDFDAEMDIEKKLKTQLASLTDELSILKGEATKAGIELHKMLEEGASAAEIAPLKALQDQIESEKTLAGIRKQIRDDEKREQERLNAQAESVRNSVMTPEEKLAQEQDRLDELLRAGAIDKTTHSRAMAKLTETPAGDTKAAGPVGALQKGSAEAMSAVFRAMRPDEIPKKQLEEQQETNVKLDDVNANLEAFSETGVAIFAGSLA
jgi:hypothetical protein